MPDLQNYAKEQIAKIVPEFDNLELRATVSDTSYSIESLGPTAVRRNNVMSWQMME